MAHVFISYVREDRDRVDRLAKDLRRHSVEVWLDRDQLRAGDRWENKIRQAIREGTFFLGCFSQAFQDKAEGFIHEELILAIEQIRRKPAETKWFIPVLLDPVPVPDRSIGAGESLNSLHAVDLSTDWDLGMAKLCAAIDPKIVYQARPGPASPRRKWWAWSALSAAVAAIGLSAVFALLDEPQYACVLDQWKTQQRKFRQDHGEPGPVAQPANIWYQFFNNGYVLYNTSHQTAVVLDFVKRSWTRYPTEEALITEHGRPEPHEGPAEINEALFDALAPAHSQDNYRDLLRSRAVIGGIGTIYVRHDLLGRLGQPLRGEQHTDQAATVAGPAYDLVVNVKNRAPDGDNGVRSVVALFPDGSFQRSTIAMDQCT